MVEREALGLLSAEDSCMRAVFFSYGFLLLHTYIYWPVPNYDNNIAPITFIRRSTVCSSHDMFKIWCKSIEYFSGYGNFCKFGPIFFNLSQTICKKKSWHTGFIQEKNRNPPQTQPPFPSPNKVIHVIKE